MPRRAAAATLVALSLVAGAIAHPDAPCAAPPAPGTVVALAPLAVPERAAVPEAGRARILDALRARLAAAGCVVLEPAAVGAAWDRAVAAAGGVFDPETGARDSARVLAARRAALAGIAPPGDSALWLAPVVELKVVEWSRGRATWDGVSETVAPLGAGTVGVLSLAVTVDDAAGARRHEGRGGIGAPVSASIWSSRVSARDPEKLFDAKRVERAVDLALEGFAPPAKRGR